MKKKKDSANDIDKLIDGHAEDVKDVTEFLAGIGIAAREIPPGIKRAIMTVEKHFKFAASDLIVKNGRTTLTTALTIKLEGTHSSSSIKGFNQAYLIFLNPDQKLQNPHLGQRGNDYTLYLTYPLSYIATVERMLKEASACYCWIGDFGTELDRDLHADLHAVY